MHHQEHSLDLINSPAHKRTLLPRQLPHAQSIRLQPGQQRFLKRTRLVLYRNFNRVQKTLPVAIDQCPTPLHHRGNRKL